MIITQVCITGLCVYLGHRQEYFIASKEKKKKPPYSSKLDLTSKDLFALILAITAYPPMSPSTPREGTLGTKRSPNLSTAPTQRNQIRDQINSWSLAQAV